jgi:hypothetical protein
MKEPAKKIEELVVWLRSYYNFAFLSSFYSSGGNENEDSEYD